MRVPKTAAEELPKPRYGSADAMVPPAAELEVLKEAALSCRACDLWKGATQTVFGEGSERAMVMMVGEQPGDQEDKQGRPFVGPAGQLLDGCLAEAGIDRGDVYITNAVKHFKWVARGARRLHQKPNRGEVVACRPWLEAEIERIDPEMIVCLGATAAQALLGPDFRLTQHRGKILPSPYRASALATMHPSAILRAPDAESRKAGRQALVSDLRLVALRLGLHPL